MADDCCPGCGRPSDEDDPEVSRMADELALLQGQVRRYRTALVSIKRASDIGGGLVSRRDWAQRIGKINDVATEALKGSQLDQDLDPR